MTRRSFELCSSFNLIGQNSPLLDRAIRTKGVSPIQKIILLPSLLFIFSKGVFKLVLKLPLMFLLDLKFLKEDNCLKDIF